MQKYLSAQITRTHSVGSTESIRSQRGYGIASQGTKSPSTKNRLLATSGLVALVFGASLFANPAEAFPVGCSVSVGGTIVCGNTVTTFTTNTNGASGSSADAIQLFNNNTPITASITAGASVTGAGLSLVEGSAINEFINLVNNAGSSVTGAANGITLTGNGGNVFYSGAGSVTGTVQTGILATNTSAGQIFINTTGAIAAGDGIGGDNHGIRTSAANGLTTIDLTGGAGISGASANGMLDSAGIYATSLSGGLKITSAAIGSASDLVGIGIIGQITGSGAGAIQISALGNIYANDDAIYATNNNTGGIAITLATGAKLTAVVVGEVATVTGAGGGITITNAAGSSIDPIYGVDAQIVNSANTSNVTIHQNGSVTGSLTGIIAATNGTGSVLVDGSGAVAGGTGAYSYTNLTAPAAANNIGIFAQNNGTAGGVTVSGSGTTSGNIAIAALISNGVNASNILVDRSGALSATGLGGVGVMARTAGLGNVTVRNTGAITGASVIDGIDAVGAGGNVLVQNVGAITATGAGGGYGIYAVTSGTGTVTVDGTSTISSDGSNIFANTNSGDILVTHTGALSGTGGVGIYTLSNTGNIVITPGSTVSNVWGMFTSTGGSGDITITTALGAGGNITGTGAAGVYANLADGDITVTNNAALIQGASSGVEAIANGSGIITITGAGDYTGGGKGISAVQNGVGPGAGIDGIVINGTGNTSSTGGTGIDARILNGANDSNILVNRSGTVTAAGNGILAATMGVGNVSVVNSGTVAAGPGQAILAASQGGNILVTPASTVSGGTGIYTSTSGAGSITVTTAFNAAGNVTGTNADGVDTTAENGNTIVTNNAATITGASWANHSLTTGLGSIVVQGAGNYVGGNSGGIYAELSGTGPVSGNGILITGTGTTSAMLGTGIDAVISNNANHSNILVNRTGAVSVLAGGGSGIVATTLGDGNVTVTGVQGVTAGTGSSAIGIDAESHGGTILVTPAGSVSGGNGIEAGTTGAGSVTVTTIAGSAGNVTGFAGFGVNTWAQDGATVVSNNAAQISGTTWASESLATGTGAITVQGAGDYVGGTSGGILAQSSGAGPGDNVTGILITGSGNTSATTGSGIYALISNPANHSDIIVNRTGNVSVQAAGGSGITANTAGDGDVTVIHVGNVQAGTGAGAFGIAALSHGGSVLVDLTSPINATSMVFGASGIQAITNGSGTVTVTTYTGAPGNVTGVNGYGVQTGAVDGNTTITNNAKWIKGSTWASWSNSGGFGAITVQGSGDYLGGAAGGILARDSGAGPGAGLNAIHITGSGNTSATTGVGITAQISNTLNASNILIDRTGTVMVGAAGGFGISGITLGTGNVTITGVGNVQAGTGGTARGIQALANGGNILITPAGTVSGAIGIGALATNAGTITITTASGAAGNVTGLVGNGIAADVMDGDAIITNNAATVSGGTNGGRGISNGLGKLTITGAGDYAGGTGNGIWATANGTGPAATNNGILITGSGNTSTTGGIGIYAEITNPANASDILINRTGTVSVAVGGGDGIRGVTDGTGNVTVTGVGNVTAGTGASTHGIYVRALGGGNVDVEPAGTVSGDMGIYAHATNNGTTKVVTVGDVTGLTEDGIHARAVDGDVNVTTATGTTVKSLGTGDGIDARAWGLGNVTILANSVVSGDPGIYATSAFGNVSVTANATTTGLLDGIYAGVTNVASTGWVWVGGTGDVLGGTNGIEAFANGSGIVTVAGSGNTTANGGVGIFATSNTGDVFVTRTGWVSASNNGINATSTGGGNVSVTGVGNVAAGGSGFIGINAVATGGNGSVLVTPAGTVSGGTGISAFAVGTGTVTVTTASGAAGNVTGTVADGIDAGAADGNIVVTNAADLVSGNSNGVFATTSGLGAITITGSGTYSGNGGNGIYAVENGVGPASGNGILISGSGNTSSTNLIGILAYQLNASNLSNILINRTGTVSGGTEGIETWTAGTGNVTVTGVGNVTGNVNYWGIIAQSQGGNVSVTPAGTVISGGGIIANTIGTGTVTVTTATGAAGNITATNVGGPGIYTGATDGNTVITNNAATVTSPYVAAQAGSLGLGTITVTGPGTYAGGTFAGIYANMNGAGPATGDGILISGTGNTSATTGTGILAGINSVTNASNIHITRSGTTSVAAGGQDGIDAVTAGTGAIIITGVGNVTAGTGATAVGIKAQAAGGNVTVSTAGTVAAGGTGIGALTTGNGTIGITAANSVTATARNGILTSAVNGNTLVTINGGTTSTATAGFAGVNEAATGSGNLGLTVASGATVSGGTTAIGAKLVQSGTGTITVLNTGTITGAGTAANPVLYVSATGTKTIAITNNAGGVITSSDATANNRPAELAIYTPVTTGAFVITNAGTLNGEIALSNQVNSLTNSGTWNVRDGVATGAAFGTSGSNTLANTGTINAGNANAAAVTTFTGINTITNGGTINAGLFSSADVTTFTASGGSQTVTNTGTINVHGLVAFAGSSNFNNAGGIVDLRTSGAATTDLVTLNTTVTGGGATHLSNTYVPGAAYNFAGGTNSRLGLDTYVGDVGSTGANVPSDRLLVSGNATGSTGILINDTNGGPGSYNPTGITLVAVNGTSSGAFALTGVTGGSDVLQASRGPLGAIKKGFWFYPLLQTDHATAAADGLSGANSTEYRLYGLPDVEAYELGLAATGAENLWYDTTQAITERQLETRDDWSFNRSSTTPNLWLKITGAWTNRTVPLHGYVAFNPSASAIAPVDTSFDQDTLAVQLGVDKAFNNVFATGDQLVAGVGLGYVSSELDFTSSHNSIGYSGVALHGSASYYNGPFFLDLLLKGDLLSVDYKFNTLSSFGYAAPSGSANSWGILSDAGLHFDLGSGKVYFEPILTIAYQDSGLDTFTALGVTSTFTDGDSTRGAIGGRLGGILSGDSDTVVTGSLTGRYWNEFSRHSALVLASAGPSLIFDDNSRERGFGEVSGRLSVAGKNWGGWSGFVSSGAKFNNEFTTVQLNGGVKYQW